MVADHDEDQVPQHAHGIHESPAIMTVPLAILALFSVIGGWVGVPAAMGGHNEIEHFLDPVFSTGVATEATTASTNHGLELGLAAVSVLVVLLGFYVAYVFYYKKPRTAAALAARLPALYRLVENKFYVDEIYGFIAMVTMMISRLILGGLIDGGIVNGSGAAAGATASGLGALVRRVQSGNIRSYAGWLALGAAAVLVVMVFGRVLWLH